MIKSGGNIFSVSENLNSISKKKKKLLIAYLAPSTLRTVVPLLLYHVLRLLDHHHYDKNIQSYIHLFKRERQKK